MPNNALIVFILVFIGTTGRLCAQIGDNAPFVYDQFFQNYYLLNPANQDDTQRFHLKLGNRTLTGMFEGVNRFYADADLALPTKNEQRFQGLGLLATNNRDGEYLNRNRLYLRYFWRTALNEYASISAGAAIGAINYFFKSSQASPGGSSTRPDANLGIWYLRQKWQLGLSYQQILKPRLQPLNQSYLLADYLNLTACYRLDFSPDIAMHTHAYLYFQSPQTLRLEIAPLFLFYDKLQLGANYRHDRGIALLLGLKSIEIGHGQLQLMASYLISTRQLTSMDDGVVEFSLGYSLPNHP